MLISKSSLSGLDALFRFGTRKLVFAGLFFLSIAFFSVPLYAWFELAIRDERYFHILLIPVISAALAFLRRGQAFFSGPSQPAAGLALIAVAAVFAAAVDLQLGPFNAGNQLQFQISALVVVWVGSVVACFGLRTIRGLAFPIALLLLMVPPPPALLERISLALQAGSAEVSYRVFQLIGMPVFREGFRFSLPGLEIEIAEQCSGIHSGLALFISALIASNLFLQSYIRRFLLCALTGPIAVFTNSVRIVTMSWLAVHVDRSFLFGKLHRYGGYPFGLLALIILIGMLLLLRTSDLKSDRLRFISGPGRRLSTPPAS